MAKNNVKIKEVDIARPVVRYLESHGWDVYQEVNSLFGIADIVAVLDKHLWIVEVKSTLSLALIAQAKRWVGSAHWVSVAIPTRKSVFCSDARRVGMDILSDLGVGVLKVVVEKDGADGRVAEHLSHEPKMIRKPNLGPLKTIRDGLVPQQKNFAEAGSVGGAHWTPYKQTCSEVYQYVKRHPGCTVKELIDEKGKYHYSTSSSARHSLSAMARLGHVPGVVARRKGRKLCLFIEEE